MKKRTESLVVFAGTIIAGLIAYSAFAYPSPTNSYPNLWFLSWSEDATNITLPIASVTGLTAASADGATGDVRQVMYTMLDHVYGSTLAAATNAVTDGVFSKMTVVKEQQYDRSTGEAIITFSVSFRLTNTVSGVVSEP